jgi:hypothetical protein
MDWKNPYISDAMRKARKMRFLLPRQVTLATRPRKIFSPGREQMRPPPAPFRGEYEGEKFIMEKSLHFARMVTKSYNYTILLLLIEKHATISRKFCYY